jgi:hypothetical protein
MSVSGVMWYPCTTSCGYTNNLKSYLTSVREVRGTSVAAFRYLRNSLINHITCTYELRTAEVLEMHAAIWFRIFSSNFISENVKITIELQGNKIKAVMMSMACMVHMRRRERGIWL